MSQYLQNGFIYFPPVLIGGPSGDYVAQCPVASCEEAEFEVIAVATNDSGTPQALITGDKPQPKQLAYDGTASLGLFSGTDGGSQVFPGIAIAWPGANIPSPPAGEYFPITDSQKRIFVRIDVTSGKAMYVTLRYRVRPIRQVVGNVATVHPDMEREHNLAREHQAAARLQARTIDQRGRDINI